MVLYVVQPEVKLFLNHPVSQPNASASACTHNDSQTLIGFFSSKWQCRQQTGTLSEKSLCIDPEKNFNMALLLMLWSTKFTDPVIYLFVLTKSCIHPSITFPEYLPCTKYWNYSNKQNRHSPRSPGFHNLESTAGLELPLGKIRSNIIR